MPKKISELILEQIERILIGWSERIEIPGGGTRRIKQQPLITQLRIEAQTLNAIVHHENKSTKAAYAPDPSGLSALDLAIGLERLIKTFHDALYAFWNVDQHKRFSIADMMHWIDAQPAHSIDSVKGQALLETYLGLFKELTGKSAVILGYQKPLIAMTGKCDCGGTLVVEQDAQSDVRCAGTPSKPKCGNRYSRYTWAAMLDAYVDTAAAVIYTGRPSNLLYKWASEGRITLKGERSRNAERWPLDQLPQAKPGEPLPPPPPLPRGVGSRLTGKSGDVR